MKKFGAGTSSSNNQAPANTGAQQPAASGWGAPQRAPAQQPPAMPAMRGLPPANPAIDTSGSGGGAYREKRKRDDEWDDAPLKLGDSEFDVVVSDVTWWYSGATITFRVHAWDRDAGHPVNYIRPDGVRDTHHGRPIKWEQFFGLNPTTYEKAYAFWRRDIVQAYEDCGWPEDRWPKDGNGSSAPPWHLFFIHDAPDGARLPIMLRVRVNVYEDKQGKRRVSVKSVRPLAGPVQAPLPFRVPPVLAEYHRWKVAKRDCFTVPGRGDMPSYNVDFVAPDNEQFALGHLGMCHYKEI